LLYVCLRAPIENIQAIASYLGVKQYQDSVEGGLAYRGKTYYQLSGPTGKEGGELIHWAAKNGYTVLTQRFLLDGSNDLHRLDGRKMNVMHLACQFGQDGLRKVLMEDGRINPNTVPSEGHSAMFNAITCGNLRCMIVILEDKRIDVNDAICSAGFKSIDIICHTDQVDLLKEILLSPALQLNTLIPGASSIV
jgi:Ankyrin repeats (3 copies)